MMPRIAMHRNQINICLIILVVIASFPCWIKPSHEAAGLSGLDQISWVIWPLVALFYVVAGKRRDIVSFVICMLGYLVFYMFVYHVVDSAGITMNVGNIRYLDAIKWSTIWLWICYLASFTSLILTIADFRSKE